MDGRRTTIDVARFAAGLAVVAGAAGVAPSAAAQQVLLQGETARLSVQPYAAASTLGGRAELAAALGQIDTAIYAALERGGGRLGQADTPAGAVQIPTAWRSKLVRSATNWSLAPDVGLTLEAENGDRVSHNFASLIAPGAGEVAHDRSSALRLNAHAEAGRLALQGGAEVTSGELETQALGTEAAVTERWLSARRLFGKLTWRATDKVTLEAGQGVQSYGVGWRGDSEISSGSASLTPSLALAATPDSRTRLRLEAERTLSPIPPDQFAAYAQLATPGAASAPEPDHGWRYGAKLDRDLGRGVRLTARADDWRLGSVTELGPVGGGEAPVGIGSGSRQQLDVALAVRPPGARTSLSGELSLKRSQVRDPFTGETRAISGEAPYRAQLRLDGALPAVDLNWSLVARADGPQRINQMTQVTALGATSGLGGAVTYGAGPVALSLELDNLIGGSREVTTYSFAGSRADQVLADIIRRNEYSRAIRISVRKPL